MKTLIIVPVFNERTHIFEVVCKIKQFKNDNSDILVIDDGSDDGSTEFIENIPGIMTCFHQKNQGYGRTLIEGFNYAIENDYQFALTIDCDEQHQPSLIPEFIQRIQESSVAIVSGSRYMDESPAESKSPQERREINQKITRKINELTDFALTDSFCGFKIYRVSSLEKLNLQEKNYGMPLELWIKAYKNGLKVEEIPVPLIYMEPDRNFGQDLDDPDKRYNYYLKVIEEALC